MIYFTNKRTYRTPILTFMVANLPLLPWITVSRNKITQQRSHRKQTAILRLFIGDLVCLMWPMPLLVGSANKQCEASSDDPPHNKLWLRPLARPANGQRQHLRAMLLSKRNCLSVTSKAKPILHSRSVENDAAAANTQHVWGDESRQQKTTWC